MVEVYLASEGSSMSGIGPSPLVWVSAYLNVGEVSSRRQNVVSPELPNSIVTAVRYSHKRCPLQGPLQSPEQSIMEHEIPKTHRVNPTATALLTIQLTIL